MKLPDKKLVIIEWEDSFETNGWSAYIRYNCISIGWVLEESSKRIIIAPHLTIPNSSKTNEDATGVVNIPKSAIRSIKKVKL